MKHSELWLHAQCEAAYIKHLENESLVLISYSAANAFEQPDQTSFLKFTTIGGSSHMREPEEFDVDEWLAIRKEEGLKINPETAEVTYIFAQTLDPYGVDPDLPEELQQVGREYFARSPGSDIWVNFGDLPEETRNALWPRIGAAIGP